MQGMPENYENPQLLSVQILENQAYVVGEPLGFQDLNSKNKQMLVAALEAFPGTLPDLDMVIQGSDWIPKGQNSSGQLNQVWISQNPMDKISCIVLDSGTFI